MLLLNNRLGDIPNFTLEHIEGYIAQETIFG